MHKGGDRVESSEYIKPVTRLLDCKANGRYFGLWNDWSYEWTEETYENCRGTVVRKSENNPEDGEVKKIAQTQRSTEFLQRISSPETSCCENWSTSCSGREINRNSYHDLPSLTDISDERRSRAPPPCHHRHSAATRISRKGVCPSISVRTSVPS